MLGYSTFMKIYLLEKCIFLFHLRNTNKKQCFIFLGRIIKALKRCGILNLWLQCISVCFLNVRVTIQTLISSFVFHSINQQPKQMIRVKGLS